MIRSVEPKDVNQIVKLEDLIFTDESPNDPSVTTITDCCENCRGFVYEDEEILGYILYTGCTDFYVNSLGVIEKARGRKIGEQLLRTLINFLDPCNLFLHVKTNNVAAIKLYEKLGFELLKTTPLRFKTIDGFLYRKKIIHDF